jgi:hypothetical protein
MAARRRPFAIVNSASAHLTLDGHTKADPSEISDYTDSAPLINR